MADAAAPEKVSNTGGIAAERLRSIVERIERLEEERKALGGDIRDIYAEAKSAGFRREGAPRADLDPQEGARRCRGAGDAARRLSPRARDVSVPGFLPGLGALVGAARAPGGRRAGDRCLRGDAVQRVRREGQARADRRAARRSAARSAGTHQPPAGPPRWARPAAWRRGAADDEEFATPPVSRRGAPTAPPSPPAPEIGFDRAWDRERDRSPPPPDIPPLRPRRSEPQLNWPENRPRG